MLECIVSKAFNGYDYIENIDIKSEHDPNGTNKLTVKCIKIDQASCSFLQDEEHDASEALEILIKDGN